MGEMVKEREAGERRVAKRCGCVSLGSNPRITKMCPTFLPPFPESSFFPLNINKINIYI